MRSLVVGIAFATSGCQLLFPLDPSPNPPPDDGSTTDAGLPAVRCVATADKVQLPLLADTFLDGTDRAHGGETSMVFGGTNRMLLRFHSFPVRPDNLILELRLERATNASECGSTCGACNESDPMPENVEVRFTRPDWDELAATSMLRDADESWATPGPGAPDVSLQAHASSIPINVTTTTLRFQVTNTPIDPSWTRETFSILLEDTVAAPMHWTSKDSICQLGAPQLIGTCLEGALCGNGTLDAGELCDDGNTDGNDECSPDCLSANS
jgi:cysteine-rich repeat protein